MDVAKKFTLRPCYPGMTVFLTFASLWTCRLGPSYSFWSLRAHVIARRRGIFRRDGHILWPHPKPRCYCNAGLASSSCQSVIAGLCLWDGIVENVRF